MHIAFYTNSYHPTVSGVVRSVSSFRQALNELGHNVFVFTTHAENYEDAEPFIFRYPSVELPRPRDFPLAIPLSSFVDRLLPSLKLDVIHSHHPFLLGQTAAVKAAKLGVPLVYTFHTRYREYSHYVPISQTFVKDQIDNWLRDYMQQCHHIVVPSESIRQMLASQYGVSEPVTTIPTGINLAPFLTADGPAIRQRHGWQDDVVLISIGRLAKEKNWGTLLTAVARVIHAHAGVRLIILGEGPEHKALQKYAQELDIAERVELPGWSPLAEVPSYLAAADLFCFASVTETQGLVTMEAMAAGLPVAAVDATGTRDAVEHGKHGLLTENDSSALAHAIEQLVADEPRRRRCGQAAREAAQSFDIRVQAKRLLAVYAQAQADARADRFASGA